MKKTADKLEFISWIKRDGSGTVPVPKSMMKTMLENPLCKKEKFKLHRLSISENTYIAINFNAFVVKRK